MSTNASKVAPTYTYTRWTAEGINVNPIVWHKVETEHGHRFIPVECADMKAWFTLLRSLHTNDRSRVLNAASRKLAELFVTDK